MSWIQGCVKKVVEEKLLVSDASTSASSDSVLLQSSKYKSGNHAKTHAFIVSSTDMKRNAAALSEAFPTSLHTRVLHAFAVKANGLKGVLEVVNEGTQGCEAASIGELMMAQKVVDNTRIVYDSPVKTIEELQYCCYSTDKAGNGVYLINVDNFAELERIAQLHKEMPIKTHVGIRVNPQVGAGSISHLSTGVATSKFGIGILDYREEIINAFVTYKDFLCGLHVHTGSQGIPLALMVKGVKTIMDLADEINAKIRHTNGSCSDNKQGEVTGGVSIIDIGGGLPVNFGSDEIFPTFQDYSAKLRDEVPSLFSGKYALVTEFGRAMVAKAGILVSRIEYVKENGGRRIILQHVGADLAVRTVWQPEHWPLRIDIVDGHNGEVKTENIAPTDVAGPCCFAKDLLSCNCPLPAATPLKDLVLVKDVGAYYHSAFSFYNLRAMPPCYLYNEDTRKLHLINPGTSIEETIKVFE